LSYGTAGGLRDSGYLAPSRRASESAFVADFFVPFGALLLIGFLIRLVLSQPFRRDGDTVCDIGQHGANAYCLAGAGLDDTRRRVF
jgi:hypothetical protein